MYINIMIQIIAEDVTRNFKGLLNRVLFLFHTGEAFHTKNPVGQVSKNFLFLGRTCYTQKYLSFVCIYKISYLFQKLKRSNEYEEK